MCHFTGNRKCSPGRDVLSDYYLGCLKGTMTKVNCFYKKARIFWTPLQIFPISLILLSHVYILVSRFLKKTQERRRRNVLSSPSPRPPALLCWLQLSNRNLAKRHGLCSFRRRMTRGCLRKLLTVLIQASWILKIIHPVAVARYYWHVCILIHIYLSTASFASVI